MVNRQDMRVFQRCRNGCFLDESGLHQWALPSLSNQLDRNMAVQFSVVSFINYPHRSPTKQAFQLVDTNRLSCQVAIF